MKDDSLSTDNHTIMRDTLNNSGQLVEVDSLRVVNFLNNNSNNTVTWIDGTEIDPYM